MLRGVKGCRWRLGPGLSLVIEVESCGVSGGTGTASSLISSSVTLGARQLVWVGVLCSYFFPYVFSASFKIPTTYVLLRSTVAK